MTLVLLNLMINKFLYWHEHVQNMMEFCSDHKLTTLAILHQQVQEAWNNIS